MGPGAKNGVNFNNWKGQIYETTIMETVSTTSTEFWAAYTLVNGIALGLLWCSDRHPRVTKMAFF